MHELTYCTLFISGQKVISQCSNHCLHFCCVGLDVLLSIWDYFLSAVYSMYVYIDMWPHTHTLSLRVCCASRMSEGAEQQNRRGGGQRRRKKEKRQADAGRSERTGSGEVSRTLLEWNLLMLFPFFSLNPLPQLGLLFSPCRSRNTKYMHFSLLSNRCKASLCKLSTGLGWFFCLYHVSIGITYFCKQKKSYEDLDAVL